MKIIGLSAVLAVLLLVVYGLSPSYQLSSDISDISSGMAVSGIPVQLEKFDEKIHLWTVVDKKVTDGDGRIENFLKKGIRNSGKYKLTFLMTDYYASNNMKSLYPFIEVEFKIVDDKHYHVPLTLSANGYSTYRAEE